MNVDSAYNVWSDTYDLMRNRTRDLDREAVLQFLIGKKFASVLELGCGTGKNTVAFAQHADHVTAVDFSDGMLQIAREKVESPNVRFLQADLTRPWPVADARYDHISVNLVLEHIRDLDFIFSQAAALLQPGGTFFLSELHPFKQYIGGKANFEAEGQNIEVTCYTHHFSEYWSAAASNGFSCIDLKEWFVDEDGKQMPRLLNLLFLRN